MLVVSYSGLMGGAERLLVSVLPALGDAVTVACPEGPLARECRSLGAPVVTLASRRLELRGSARDRAMAPLRLAAQAREVRALVTSLAPEAVLAWSMRAALTCAAALRGLPAPPRLVFQHNDFLPAGPAGRLVRAAARRADLITAPSHAVARDLGLPAEVIPPGVDLLHHAAAPAPPGPPRVLVLGAIVPWKRQDLALEAVALASRELPDVGLILAGREHGEAGRALATDLRRRAGAADLAGRLELTGELADPRKALRRAHCLLHCAEREPYGLAIAEALATGVPVVATDAEGPAEIVDESCGRLYPPGDPGAAAAAIVEVLRDPGLRARARAKAERDLDLEHTRRAFAAVIARLAPPRPAAPAAEFAIATVTHESERDLPRLLGSIDRHLPGTPVVVVDSGSSDGSAELAREWGATVIELGENVGFGRASNVGVRHVDRPVTVLLNPDTELVDSSLAELAARAAEGERLLAPAVLAHDGSRMPYAQRAPASAAAAVSAVLPPGLLPRPLARRLEPWRSNRPVRAAWAAGCCIAARTDLLRRLGPFDESIFMYGEDLELGLRAGSQGVETWFDPRARILHAGGSSAARAFGGEPFELLARQRQEVVGRRLGRRAARADLAIQALTHADRLVLKRLLGRPAQVERRRLAALRRARRF